MENDRGKKKVGTSSVYRGVRKRQWGKWVSEIREPNGERRRIWLGSFETPEMAAAAYDAAAFYLRGNAARVNFPHLVDILPRPASSSVEDMRIAAQDASLLIKKQVDQNQHNYNHAEAAGSSFSMAEIALPETVGLSPGEIQAMYDSPLESPSYKTWMEMASCSRVFQEPVNFPHEYDYDYEEVPDDSLWDP